MVSSIEGQYKVIACQLKTRWLAPGVWSHYIWEIKNDRFKLHNHEVCPSNFVGSFVKSATQQWVPVWFVNQIGGWT